MLTLNNGVRKAIRGITKRSQTENSRNLRSPHVLKTAFGIFVLKSRWQKSGKMDGNKHKEDGKKEMGAVPVAPVTGKSGKKICCSCPDTKQLRDDCVVKNGPEKCEEYIEAHKACLRAEGFIVN